MPWKFYGEKLNKQIGLTITSIYRYFYIFHNEPIQCSPYTLTKWIEVSKFFARANYNFHFRDEYQLANVPFLKRCGQYLWWRIPPFCIIKHFRDQIKWRLWRKWQGLTWNWRL